MGRPKVSPAQHSFSAFVRSSLTIHSLTKYRKLSTMSRPQGMPDYPHVNPPQRLRIHRRPPPPTPPTQDSPDGVPGTPVTPQHLSSVSLLVPSPPPTQGSLDEVLGTPVAAQHLPSVPSSAPTPPPFMDRQVPNEMQLFR
jgi:hypothetical protein